MNRVGRVVGDEQFYTIRRSFRRLRFFPTLSVVQVVVIVGFCCNGQYFVIRTSVERTERS